jgi:PTS system fructose-specific IIA component
LIVPKEAAGNEHLMMISQLATNLLEDEFRDEVKSATDKSVLKEYILKNMKENN